MAICLTIGHPVPPRASFVPFFQNARSGGANPPATMPPKQYRAHGHPFPGILATADTHFRLPEYIYGVLGRGNGFRAQF